MSLFKTPGVTPVAKRTVLVRDRRLAEGVAA
jgi:hypothetical protein